MKKQLKKSGQKFLRKFSRTSQEVSEKSKAHIKEHVFARVGNIRPVRLWVLEWLLLVALIVMLAVIQSIWYQNSYEFQAFAPDGVTRQNGAEEKSEVTPNPHLTRYSS